MLKKIIKIKPMVKPKTKEPPIDTDNYQLNYNIRKEKIENSAFNKSIHIKFLLNKSFNKNGITKQNLTELNQIFTEVKKIAKEKNIKLITFNTWIFLEYPKLYDYFRKKYNLSLHACNFDDLDKFGDRFEQKKIKGINFTNGKLYYENNNKKTHEMSLIKANLPEYAFEIKD